MSITQRCIYVEGIGRCHVLESATEFDVATIDADPYDFALGCKAADIIAGSRPGRILWSVRFKEKVAA